MSDNVRPQSMERITTPELAKAFIEEQIEKIKEQKEKHQNKERED